MGDKIELKLDKREVYGKKVARLRKEGQIPAVVYGPDVEPMAVQADYRLIDKVVAAASYHTPVHITVDGKKLIAMIKDVAISPAKNNIQHVSFHAVRQNEPVNAVVPIVLIGEGESEAERAGLVVLQALEQLEVRALPMALPEALEADIRELKEAGDRVLVADIAIPEGVTIIDNEALVVDKEDEEAHRITDLVVASAYEPSALQAANEAAAGDAEDESEVLSGDETEEADESSEGAEGESSGADK